jgi:peptidoglycan/xylan/chitin deacetylase (PgdA/CDA1 family)
MPAVMKTLRFDVADLELGPIGAGRPIAGELIVRYDRTVAVDGKVLPAAPRHYPIPATGLVDVQVLPNDDPAITSGAGFGIVAEVALAGRDRHGTGVRRVALGTKVVPSTLAGPVSWASLPFAASVPASVFVELLAAQEQLRLGLAPFQGHILVDVDAPAGLGPLTVGIDGQAMQLDPMSVRPLTQATVDAPSDGLWAVGPNGQAVNLLSGGGSTPTPVHAPEPATRLALDAKARRLVCAPRRTTKAVVAIVADDYPKSTLDILAPEMTSRNLPWSWNVCAGQFDAGFLYSGTHVGTKTWADVAALDPAKVELINHGWSHNDVTDDAMMWHEIVESRDRIRTETGREVLGWMPPGVDYPGLRWKSMPLVRFNGGEDNYPTTVAGRLILDHHAWGTCTLARPGDTDNTHPLDGSPRWLCSRGWIDASGDLGVQVGGQGDTSIAAAIARGHGVILSLHAAYIEGGTQPQRISLAGLRAFLDRVKAKRDAGDIDVVLMTPWHYSQIGA